VWELKVANPTQVRILFVNCPRLDTLACAYLLLAQNEVQREFEFSVHHHWVFAGNKIKMRFWHRSLDWWSEQRLPFRKWARGRFTAALDLQQVPVFKKKMSSKDFSAHITELLQGHDTWFRSLPPSYGGNDLFSGATIVITETPFEGAYFASAEENVAVITVAHWHRHFAPPSVLEFVLRMVQRYTARVAFLPVVGSHYSTRGCIWDFDANVNDARITTTISFICANCESALSRALPPEKLDALKKLIDHRWIGKIEDTGSIASNLRRMFEYDLARTRGLSPSFLDRVKDVGTAQLATLFVKTIVVVVASVLSLLILHKLKFNITDFLPKP
jgi:hypothetical protein